MLRKYYVICEQECSICQGNGWINLSNRIPCTNCQATGIEKKYVTLVDALRDIKVI